MTTTTGIIIVILLLAGASAVVLWPTAPRARPVDPEEAERARLRGDLRSALRREADRMALPEDYNAGLTAEFRRLADLMDCNEITWGHAYTSGAAWIRARSPRKPEVDREIARIGAENGGGR